MSTYKITTFQNVPFAGSCKLTEDKLQSNGGNDIVFPSGGGTLATAADITALGETYLTQTDASSTYLTQTNASSTYATQTTVSTLQTKFNNLLDYLETWINAGNLSMADIKTAVNGSS